MVARGTEPGKQWIHSILYFRILIQWNIYQNTFLISGKKLGNNQYISRCTNVKKYKFVFLLTLKVASSKFSKICLNYKRFGRKIVTQVF